MFSGGFDTHFKNQPKIQFLSNRNILCIFSFRIIFLFIYIFMSILKKIEIKEIRVNSLLPFPKKLFFHLLNFA